MNMADTIRAKVLQYKSDGNTLTDKWHTLTKFAEGIYLSYAAPDRYGQVYVTVVFAKNGVFWKVGCEPEQCFRPDSFRYAEHVGTLKRKYADYEANIIQAATNGGWLNKLHITVMARLGHDTAAMIEAYNEKRRQIEERDRLQAEEAERREHEHKKAEEDRKAEVLAAGKEKLLKHERITVEQIELIAEAVGYKIHIRTIGFMREKVTGAVIKENSTVTVSGYKLTSRNIDGTANVMHELYNRLKAQAEEEAKQSATPTETPQISTETAEAINVSAEGEKEVETKEMPQILNCEWQTVEHFKAIPNIAKLAKAGIIINGVAWHTEYLDQTHNVLARVDNLGWDMKMHTFPYQGSGVFGKTELFENWEDAVIATIDALTDHLKAQLQTEPREVKYRVSRLSGYKIIVGDREQSKVIAVLMSVDGHNTIEINDESANIATMGEKPLQIDKPIMQLSDAEVLELVYGCTEPPQSPKRKIKYFHYTPEQLKRYIIDVYDKRSNGEWVLDHQEDTDNGYYDVIDDKVIYWHNKSANSFSYANMDFDSPTCGRCFRINSTYQKEKYVVSNEILLEFMCGDTYRNIHKQTVYNNGKYEHYYTIHDRYGDFNVGDFSYTFDGIVQRFNDDYKDYATIIWQSPEFSPQSPETSQTVECTADAPEARETARKRPTRALAARGAPGDQDWAQTDIRCLTAQARHWRQ